MKKLVSLLLCLSLCLGLGAPALASTAPEDLFRPQAWFGDWADSYELIDWDFYDDTNAAGLILTFTSEPVAGQDLFDAYTARLEESDLVTETSRQSFESEYGDYDQEICYTYMGAENVGSVTSLLGGTVCELALHQVWLADGYPRIVFAWGDGFPMEVYPDGIDAMSAGGGTSAPAPAADSAPVTGPVIPDGFAFFNQEVTHSDELQGRRMQCSFTFDPDHIAATYEYVDLLQNGGFGLVQTATAKSKHGDITYYAFDYTGSESVNKITAGDLAGAVIVQINDFTRFGMCQFIINYSTDMTVADTGDRCSVTGLVDWRNYSESTGPMGSGVAEGGGSSSGGGLSLGSGTDYGSSLECSFCHGSGDCPTCGGDGYLWSSAADTENRMCYSCSGSGNCSHCGGTGKR